MADSIFTCAALACSMSATPVCAQVGEISNGSSEDLGDDVDLFDLSFDELFAVQVVTAPTLIESTILEAGSSVTHIDRETCIGLERNARSTHCAVCPVSTWLIRTTAFRRPASADSPVA